MLIGQDTGRDGKNTGALSIPLKSARQLLDHVALQPAGSIERCGGEGGHQHPHQGSRNPLGNPQGLQEIS